MRSRHWIKACLYALALVVPGSLLILGVVWLVRLCLGRAMGMDGADG